MEMLSATLPLAMSAAMLAAGRVRDRRRREMLNQALHELRRPLQSIALVPADPRRLDQVRSALDDLEGAINGTTPAPERVAVELRPLVEAAVSRWREAAPREAMRPSLRWRAGDVLVEGDSARLVRAIDNLVANALEHGRPPVELIAIPRSGRLRLLVRDCGPRELGTAPAGDRSAGPGHGHGLTIVRQIAAEHGGRFALRRSAAGSVAALDLPLAAHAPSAA